MECRQSFEGEPAYTRRCERHSHHAAEWRIGQGEMGLTIGPGKARSLPMPFVSITRLRVRRWRYLPRFLFHFIRAARQAKRAAGSLAVAVLRDTDRALWTSIGRCILNYGTAVCARAVTVGASTGSVHHHIIHPSIMRTPLSPFSERGKSASEASHGRTMKASISNSPDRKKLKNPTLLYLHVSHKLISTRCS